MKLVLALALLSSAARAQTVLLRPSLGSGLSSPVPAALSPALSAPSVVPLAPSLIPSLTPAAPAPAPLAAAKVIPGASSAESAGDKPGTPRAAQSLAKAGADFARLVAELTGEDPEKAAAAAVSLKALKDEHLNRNPDGKKTPILDLKPMQIAAGMIEVKEKADDLREKKVKESEAWLKERSVPVLEDYKGRKRPVDHHHETRAAWEAGLDKIYTHRYLDDELHARLKALPRAQFYAVTRAMGLFYDRDQFGAGPHDPNHLPEDVRGMADDPFRSVAWQVRKRGGYDKTAVPFAEFKWAQYFRERVKTYPTRADFETAVAEALALAHDAAAKDLPGWRPR